MAIELPAQSGRSLLLDALAQNDVDMAFHRLLNLDTSNLPPIGIPPTITPPENQWLHDWSAELQTWRATQPDFIDLSGNLTQSQQRAIKQTGVLTSGTWNAKPIDPPYLPTLDLIRAPAAAVSLNHFKITNLANPVDPGDAVNRGFMDFMLQGLQPKQAVQWASVGNMVPATLDRPVDGSVLPSDGDRILLKDQSNPAENGIWIAHDAPWDRAPDCNTGDLINRAYCAVLEGDINAGTSWVQSLNVSNINFNTDPKQFLLFMASEPGSHLMPGRGLDLEVNNLNVIGTDHRISVNGSVDIAADYVGQASIVTLGTVTTGAWEATILDSQFGGTGINNGSHTIALGGIDLSFEQIGGAIPGTSLLLRVTPGGSVLILPPTGTLATLAGIETLTNKRITKRVQKISSAPKPAINSDALDVFYIIFLSENITSMSDNLTGTPTDGQELIIWIMANPGVVSTKNIFWGSKYDASSDLPLPIIAQNGLWMFHRFTYNLEKGKWVLVAFLEDIPA